MNFFDDHFCTWFQINSKKEACESNVNIKSNYKSIELLHETRVSYGQESVESDKVNICNRLLMRHKRKREDLKR